MPMFNGAFDISHHNGNILWSKIPPEYKLVFIKASQGQGFVDPKFDKNKEGALDTKRMVIPYHFATKTDTAKAQVANFEWAGELVKGSVAMIDWEADITVNLPSIKLIEEIIDRVQEITLRAPIIYHGIYTLASARINKCPWHVPKYGPMPKGKWLFWQNTSSQKIAGIPTPVDHDIFNGTETELINFYQNGVMPEALR